MAQSTSRPTRGGRWYVLRPATLILGLLGLLGLGIMYWVNWARGQNLAATHARVIQAGLSGFLCGVIAWRARSF